MSRRSVALLAAAVCCSLVLPCPAQTAPTQPANQELELATLVGQLKDPARSPKTKAEAAGMLLLRPGSQASEILLSFLSANDNPAAQIAIAEAIASSPLERKEFVEPLLAILTGGDPTVRGPAAGALARYKDREVVGKLLAVAVDGSLDVAIRTETIAALRAVPDKQTVETMVRLLDDPLTAVRRAAAESLAKLTDIRAFGEDPSQWKQWWEANKDKDRSTWLIDLADSLARAKAALEADNARLRERLVRTLSDLYDAAAAAQRDAMLVSFLKDPLADVRLVGLKLVDRKIASNEPVPPDVRLEVWSMLTDGDSRVRQESATILASLADTEALGDLLERLQVEQSPEVREALLKALGQLRQAEALPAVLSEISSKYENVAAAAASALARIATKAPLDVAQRGEAAEALVARYKQIDPSGANGVALREALLSAMGVVGDESVMPVLKDAIKDPAAKVRLAAVGSLAKVGKADAAGALAALTADSDRGVRQAAIAALGTVGGSEHLPTILNLTNPAIETDAPVRQQAWEVALAVLAQADEQTLLTVAGNLAAREDALPERVKILQMLVEKLKARNGPGLALARRRLGEALMQAKRPAEAAAPLADAYAAYAARNDSDALVVWDEWLDALIASDDPASLTAMANQTDEQAVAGAFRRLLGRVSELNSQGKYLPVIVLAAEGSTRLGERLSDKQLKTLQQMAQEAKAKQAVLDQQKVSALVPLLGGGDEAARNAAGELVAMSSRAILPLLAELRKTVTSDPANPQLERNIVDLLRQVSPKLTGYDPSAPAQTKLELLDSWARQQRQ